MIDGPVLTPDSATPTSTPARLGTELRQTTRNSVSWRARVASDGVAFVDCRTFDISLGGIGLLCQAPLSRDTVFMVALQVPPTGSSDGFVVTSKAKAMFQILSGHEYRIGMQWAEPDDPALAVLGAWSMRRG